MNDGLWGTRDSTHAAPAVKVILPPVIKIVHTPLGLVREHYTEPAVRRGAIDTT